VIAEIVGASLTAFTVKINVLVFVSAPSVTTRLTVLDPLAFVTGIMVTVQFGYVPPITIPPFDKTEVVEEVADTDPVQVRVESTSSIVKGIAAVATFSFVNCPLIAEIVGASLTALTVTPKTLVAFAVPSLTVKVTVAFPLAFNTGVITAVQFG
jgi:hypothetical protein